AKALAGRVNLTEISASALLRKPTGNHHGGQQVIDVSDVTGLRSYSILYNWMLAGLQPGGVAASALVNGGNLGSAAAPVLLTYSGAPPFSPVIPVDASASIGATNFLWTVSGSAGPTGEVAFFANPTAKSTTLRLPNSQPNFGTYLV